MPSPNIIAPRRPIAANRLIEAINLKGRSTTYTYDTLDRLQNRSDVLGGTTQLSYDANDNPLTVVDVNTHAIETNVYDLRNRLTRRTDATGKPTAYQYDANDNLMQATYRKGQITTLQYDALNRPSQISDADGRISVQLRHSPPSATLVATMHRLSADPMFTHPMVPLTCVVF